MSTETIPSSFPAQREAEDEYYLQKLSSFNGVTTEDLQLDEIAQFYDLVRRSVSNGIHKRLFRKYVADFDGNFPGRKLLERSYRFVHTYEALIENSDSTMSYGQSIPTYLRALKQYQKSHRNEDHHTSLLVGASSAYTVLEHAATVKTVFPEAKAITINLEDYESHDFGGSNVVLASGLSLPIRRNSVDTIHTNALLFHLQENPRSSHQSSLQSRFFSEIYRALRPGGAICLVEFDPTIPPQEFVRRVSTDLDQAHFSNIQSHPTTVFHSRREIDRFILGDQKHMNPDRCITVPALHTITAVKPKQ